MKTYTVPGTVLICREAISTEQIKLFFKSYKDNFCIRYINSQIVSEMKI